MILFYAQITFMVTDVKLNTNILICHWFETKTSTHRSARRWRRARRLFRHWIWTTCSRGRCRGQRSSGSHGRRRCHRWPGARPRCALTRGGEIYIECTQYWQIECLGKSYGFFFCLFVFTDVLVGLPQQLRHRQLLDQRDQRHQLSVRQKDTNLSEYILGLTSNIFDWILEEK